MYELKDNELVFAKVKPGAVIPTKREEDAGYDIYACFPEDYMVIHPHSTKLIPTGIASAMTDKWYLQVEERGSSGVKGMKKSAGIIDSGFRNEIFVALTNANAVPIIISKYEKDELFDMYAYPYNKRVLLDDRVNSENDELDITHAIIYPYSKAIAQLLVHEVPKMEVNEISYEELFEIPSERGVGMCGSSNK